ncbi:pyridoxamine 5'-phosphate oxidase family protein [Frateuria sp.]|uniref:pyridoxamine 5'-phosphate oxidase family protein n=1 Tax=Frateuria sp. TaxID=2211372 RepID=UPI0018444876|nr:pyridoxamine 5'-phosphate oxidase family protein [Frateuria sp.]NUR21993.1 pyridoxamine 5'-phosphate oxidase family protein [Frateuria sp.]
MRNDAPADDADLRKLAELIDDIEVAMLTTQAADGSLVSRPLQTLKLTAEGDLVFFTAADSAKVHQLTNDLDVNLAYANHDDKRYVSVRGRARIDRDPALVDELWTPAQNVYFSGKDDPNLAVLRVRVRDAMYWESAGNFAERALDFARGMWSEQPHDLGTRGHLHG